MQEVSKDIFYRTIQGWEWISHTQLDVWCTSLFPEHTLRYYVDAHQPSQFACVGYVCQKAGLSMLIIQGECMRGAVDHKMVREFYSNVDTLGYDIVEINSDSLYSTQFEVGIREAGLLRPVGLFSTTLSKLIDLRTPIQYDKNWKNNLKKADQYGLSFRMYDAKTITNEIIDSYLEIQEELTKRKHFAENLDHQRMHILLQDSHFVLGTVWHEGVMVSGMVALMDDGKRAMSLYSATSSIGRKLSASYLLRREVMAYAINERNIPSFDMGRMSPSIHSKNNIFLFKNGIEGNIVQYNGEWLWCSHKWLPLVLYFINKYVWKRVQV